MDTVKPARKHRNDDMFGRQGSYISRTHAARTDTIRRPESNGGNYDNQAYLNTPHGSPPGSPLGSNQMDEEAEMTSLVPNAPQREQSVHHGQPPSYEEGESCSQVLLFM